MQIRPRLTPDEYKVVQEHRELTKEFEDLPEALPRKIPKVLVIDVETSPMSVFVWGLYKQRISHENIITDWNLLSWCAKWLGDKDVMSDVLTPEEAVAQDDKRIMESLWKVLNDSEVVIAHHGIKFDLRKINARFLYHRLKPPTSFQVIDTLKASQKAFGTSSHRLDYLGKFLLNRGKMDTDFDLWRRCYYGDEEALKYMRDYNIEDVRLLENVYFELRPYIRPHPNFGIYSESEEPVCVYCGNEGFEETGIYVTAANRYKTIRCVKCGGIMRQRTTDITKTQRNNLLISIAR